MKFELRLDGNEVREAIEHAVEEGVEDFDIIIEGTVEKGGKVKIDKKYIFGECTTEFITDI